MFVYEFKITMLLELLTYDVHTYGDRTPAEIWDHFVAVCVVFHSTDKLLFFAQFNTKATFTCFIFIKYCLLHPRQHISIFKHQISISSCTNYIN